MPKTAKISISLPDQVLDRADRARRDSGETRSELFRRALEALFREQERKAAVRRYLDGYVAEPETDYEVAATESTAQEAWQQQDWQPDDRDEG